MGNCCGTHQQRQSAPQKQQQLQTWARTGIVVLRDRRLKDTDLRAYDLPPQASLLDVSCNRLTALPEGLLRLQALQKLNASHNQLSQLAPHSLSFAKLKVLNLDNNQLRELPPLSQLPQLQELSASRNVLDHLPDTLGALKQLTLLNLTNNHLHSLPGTLGDCTLLQEADLASNQLQVLPDSTSKLTRLKTLRLDHNNFSVLPPGLLEGCTALQTLSLHGNTCDVEVLHAMPGFAAFERRRQRKADKVVHGSAMAGRSTFDEGLDR